MLFTVYYYVECQVGLGKKVRMARPHYPLAIAVRVFKITAYSVCLAIENIPAVRLTENAE